MSIHSVERRLPYASIQLFDLVADVEHYPEFVPWWVAANVWKRHENVYYTRQVLGLPFLRQEFQSRTTLHRPQHINIRSIDSPFRNLDMNWSFMPAAEGGTFVQLQVNIEWRATRYEFLSRLISDEGIRHLVDTFEGRAAQLFGRPVFLPSPCDLSLCHARGQSATVQSSVQHSPIRLTRLTRRTRSCATLAST